MRFSSSAWETQQLQFLCNVNVNIWHGTASKKKSQWHLAHGGETATAQCHWLEMLKIGGGFESMTDIWRSLCLPVMGFQNIHSSLCKWNFASPWPHMGNSSLLGHPQSPRQPNTNSLVNCLKHFARDFLQSTWKKNHSNKMLSCPSTENHHSY